MKNQDEKCFNEIRKIVSSEFEVQSDFFEQRSHLPKVTNAFRALTCLCIASNISGVDIGYLTGRCARSIYKTRNSGYRLLEKDLDFREKFTRAKKKSKRK